jgi:hypothetical protein
MLSLMLTVTYAECLYAEWHYAECHYAEWHYAECHYAECHYAEGRNTECRGTKNSVGNTAPDPYKVELF